MISSAEPLLFHPRRGCWPDMDTRQAAAHIGRSPNYLNSLRSRNEGPAYCKIGRKVRYVRSEVESWARDRRVK